MNPLDRAATLYRPTIARLAGLRLITRLRISRIIALSRLGVVRDRPQSPLGDLSGRVRHRISLRASESFRDPDSNGVSVRSHEKCFEERTP